MGYASLQLNYNLEEKMKLSLILLVGLVLVACGGRKPAPVMTIQPNDKNLACNVIEAELVRHSNNVTKFDLEQGQRLRWNIGWGIGGAILWPLWFALDAQDAPAADKSAAERRIRQLNVYSNEKNCK